MGSKWRKLSWFEYDVFGGCLNVCCWRYIRSIYNNGIVLSICYCASKTPIVLKVSVFNSFIKTKKIQWQIRHIIQTIISFSIEHFTTIMFFPSKKKQLNKNLFSLLYFSFIFDWDLFAARLWFALRASQTQHRFIRHQFCINFYSTSSIFCRYFFLSKS